MRAFVLEAPGRASSLAFVSRPTAGAGQILVRVGYSSVNPFDVLSAAGNVPPAVMPYRFPAVLGRDVCGEVVEIGAGVTRYRVGDRVWGFVKRAYIGDGTFAEYVCISQDEYVQPLPDGLRPEDAGCLGLASVTALQCVTALNLSSGSSILINGATGGVGTMATQLAASAGLRVVATARGSEEQVLMRELGAERTIDWSDGSISEQVNSAVGRVAGLIDLISSDADTFAGLLSETVAVGGAAVTTRGAAVAGSTAGVRTENIFSRSDVQLLARIARHIEARELRVLRTREYAFDEIAEAMAAISEGAVGKVALRISD